MTPFIAFLIGTFGSGFVLALVFGALSLDAGENAYWKGYNDALSKVHSEARKAVENEKDGY